MKEESNVIIQLGTNLGNRRKNLHSAINLLSEYMSISKKSSIFETAAWGKTDQQDFLNQVLEARTQLTPYQLLELCKSIEYEMGRKRDLHWGPRIIDLDIIFYGNKIIFSPDLEIPHPYMQDRRFVLEPMNEICPSWKHPLMNQTVEKLLSICDDQSNVKRTGN